VPPHRGTNDPASSLSGRNNLVKDKFRVVSERKGEDKVKDNG